MSKLSRVMILLVALSAFQLSSTASSQADTINGVTVTATGATIVPGPAAWVQISSSNASQVISLDLGGNTVDLTNLNELTMYSVNVGVQGTPASGYDKTINVAVGYGYFGSAKIYVNNILSVAKICPSGSVTGIGDCTGPQPDRAFTPLIQINYKSSTGLVSIRIPNTDTTQDVLSPSVSGDIVFSGTTTITSWLDIVNVSGIPHSPTSTDNSAAEAKAAAAAREAEKRNARAEILGKFKNSESIPFELFARADIPGITKENYEAVQAEVATSPEAPREDLVPILKIARKYEVVGNISSERIASILSNSLIEIGLIPEDSKHKEALTAAIKKLPVDERSSYAEIKEAIDNEMAEIQARKDRYAAILARITSRND